MIKEAIGVAATVDEARKMAVENLHAPIDADVKVEVITFPKKKVLGLFGGADAKVKAYYDDGVSEKKPEPVAKPAPAKEKKTVAENKPAPKKETPKKEVSEKETVDLSAIPAKEDESTAYLKSIIEGMGYSDVTVTAKENGNDVYFEIQCGEDCGNLIGRRGETLDALQYLTRLFVNRMGDNNKRVSLNIGDYRKRREETLRGLAKRQSLRVVKTGRSVTLDPMNPYERRIVHTAVQEIEGVTSHSVGEGDRRRVVITPEGDRRDGGYRGGRNDRRNNREKKAPYVPANSGEPREKKVDAVSSSRYGKIEPKKQVEETEE